MNIDALLSQIETIPALSGKVAFGTPPMVENIGSSPYAWVVSVSEVGGPSPVVGPVRQRIEVTIEVVVGARSLADLKATRQALKTALVNFQIDKGYEPVSFATASMVFGDAGWNYWSDQYTTAYWFDTADQVFI